MNRKLLLFLFTEMLTDVGRICIHARASDKSANYYFHAYRHRKVFLIDKNKTAEKYWNKKK